MRYRPTQSARGTSFLVLLLVGVLPARAHTTIVPDDFPTIQAAIDHLESPYVPDTLLVRGGNYPERPVLHIGRVVRAIAAANGTDQLPVINGIQTWTQNGDTFEFNGLRFSGQVVVGPTNGPESDFFRDCQFDAGAIPGAGHDNPDLWRVEMSHCTLSGTVWIRALEATVDSSTVHGPLIMDCYNLNRVRDDVFEGIAGTAVTVRGEGSDIGRNRVRGCGNGFDVVVEDGYSVIEDNDIEGCSGYACSSYGYYGEPTRVQRNRITKCGAHGIFASGSLIVLDNTVTDCGGPGLDLSHDDGSATVQDNVVGRCGQGIVLVAGYLGYDENTEDSMLGNTAYACTGSGFLLQYVRSGAVARNIAAVNGKAGLEVVGGNPLALTCNDWFANTGGATSGVSPAATDLAVDPLFCDLAADDVQLRSDSPLLAAPGCGLIGALGKGCEPPPVVIELELKQDVLPAGAHGGWVTAWLEPRAPFAASDVDIASVRLNGVPAASDGHIGDRDRDGLSDLQLRFDREAVGQTLGRGAVATVTVTGTMRGRQLIGTDAVRIPHGQSIHRPSDLDPEASAPVLAIGAPITNGIGGRIRVAFSLADASSARLDVLDVAGRVVLTQDVGGAGPGEHTMELGDRGRLAQGIYFLRIRQAGSEARTRAAIVR
jgi:hypothetical protein